MVQAGAKLLELSKILDAKPGATITRREWLKKRAQSQIPPHRQRGCEKESLS